MEIEIKTEVASAIPSEIGVTLFRILQEALHNAIKHSGVKRIEVRLWEQLDEIHLEVRDWGKGFEILAATQGRGVGLVSMDERVRLGGERFPLTRSLIVELISTLEYL